MSSVTLADIEAARSRLAPYLAPTPLEEAPALGKNIWLKLENANKTHAFKIRGALNAMLSLDDAARARGIVTASSGNHAQGIACAAYLLGAKARIVMSRHASPRKMAGVRQWGGEVIPFGDSYGDAEGEARRLEREHGYTYISPYNDPVVVAGQGTIGLEILDVLPQVERVIVPIGGGGLISGIALALKSLRPRTRVIGVNPAETPTMYNQFYKTDLPDADESIADALPGKIEQDSITLDLTSRHVDNIVLVDENAIVDAMRWLLLDAGWLVEGGGAVGIAALQSGVIPNDGKQTCVVISGGNVDAAVIRRVVQSGA